MQKVIINTIGLGLAWTNKAVVEILRRKCISAVFDHIVNGEAVRVSKEEFVKLPDNECRVSFGHDDNPADFDGWEYDAIIDGDFFRDDETAISVLEEYGSEYCSGEGCCLAIEAYDDELFRYEVEELPFGGETVHLKPWISYDRAEAMSKAELIAFLQKQHIVQREPWQWSMMEKN